MRIYPRSLREDGTGCTKYMGNKWWKGGHSESTCQCTAMDTKPHELCGTSVEGEDPRNTNDGHQESKRQI
jgi:hypothetical protein